jgi:amino acid adenylation domain-containing protein
MTLERVLVRTEDRLPAFRHRELELSADEVAGLVGAIREAYADAGLRRGDRVAVAATKSVRTIAAIYAALADGIVFVPVDPDSPLPRLGHILDDADAGMVVVDAPVHERAAAVLEGRPLASFEDLGEEAVRRLPASAPPRPAAELFAGDELDEELTAYLMYTSGSTGRPKGVQVPRGALASFLASAVQRAGYRADTVFLNFFPLHFDPVLMEILVPWAVGGQVVIFDRMRMVNDLVDALHDARVTDFSCTPNVISLLVGRFSTYARRPSEHLRTIWSGGESPNVEHVRRFQEISPGVQLFNGYGPTETVIACSLYDVPDLRTVGPDWQMSIGTPFAGADFVLVDDHGRDVEQEGVTGELLVGGRQVMSGYRGLDPDDPAAHGFVERPEGRYYRTGDLVLRHEGRYVFVGRLGGLVKVRGYRVHLAEVEGVLRALDGVSEAVVLYDEEVQALRAVVEGRGVDHARALRHLEERLPEYMVPDRVEVVAALPRLSNGKLDLQRIGSGPVEVGA